MEQNQANNRHSDYIQLDSSSTNILSHINPWIIVWWSAAFPGAGHLLLGIKLTAYILIVFELIVNNMANINDAIFLSMIGDFHGAKEVLEKKWFFGYMGIFVFSMYDGYRRTVELNKIYLLSYRTMNSGATSKISSWGRNFVDLSSPGLSLFWSFITPGTGAVLVTRIPAFIFALSWWGVTVINSHWFEGIYYTAIGDFEHAKVILEPQWLLFIPSIILFSMYYGYHDTIKENKAFKISQAKFFKENYQSPVFKKPI
ncbi:hypothetical protein BK138_35110 [Paenibacillus rhizosphaerae]|uniref:Uncharacterized protein n=1 Tax=Paenibacillus rhizosphaerae TaxID=297318 RepID=A0A1R1DWK1_9BACL|nr:hypothetical protein [Paenibacillus rhizosphaerae]OMF43994.1 hypothetical protein BK138_35110 [Paenibacillus rhizosphaerae]